MVLKAFCNVCIRGTGLRILRGSERNVPDHCNLVSDEKNHSGFEDLLHELSIEHVEVQDTSSGSCAGLSFVITGDVHHYKNRDEFKAYVESQGRKSDRKASQKKTAYLVNNDVESASSKNRKAKNWEFRLFPKIHL